MRDNYPSEDEYPDDEPVAYWERFLIGTCVGLVLAGWIGLLLYGVLWVSQWP